MKLEDIAAAKKKCDAMTQEYLSGLANSLHGFRVILDTNQQDDLVFLVNQRTYDAFKRACDERRPASSGRV